MVFAPTVSKDASDDSFWFLTNVLGQTLQSASDNGLKYGVIDRPNPLARRRVEPMDLIDEYKPFASYARVARGQGLSFGEIARRINGEQMLGVEILEVGNSGASPPTLARLISRSVRAACQT